MRLLLANLPWSYGGRLGVRAGSRWPFTSPARNGRGLLYVPFPFFLAYSAALLKKENKEILIIDAVAEGLDEDGFIARAKDFSPRLIVVETSTPSFNNDIRIINSLRDKMPGTQVALCGPHASVFPQKILLDNEYVDYVLCGEYEYTLLELAISLEEGRKLDSVAGLAYRQDAEARMNIGRPAIKDLDGLPWPEREELPLYKYNDAFAGLPVPNVQILSSRGCPFRCNFCLWPQVIYGECKYRPRDPLKVADEMEYLVKHFGFKAVYFDDDTFNADKEHVLGVCAQIKKRKIGVPWAVMARPDLMDKEMLASLSEAGLCAVKYGVESADDSVLRLSGKNLDLEKAKENIILTRKMGIKTHLTFCLGLPGETRESVEKTLRFKKEMQPDSCQFSLAVPFPGTDYFNCLKKKGLLISEDWDDYDGNKRYVIKNDSFRQGELEDLVRWLDRRGP